MRRIAPLLLLTGCVITQPPPPVAELPPPVWPDQCVENWYVKATLPPCVESWISDLTVQQTKIQTKHKVKLK